MNIDALQRTACALVASGRGILAADESTGTIKKRFDAIGVENSETARRDYRELLFRSEAMRQHISGVILYDETIWQNAADGTPFVDLIKSQGSIPGIKVDEGTEILPFTNGETITKGLDHLSRRLGKYYEQGARFAKWRAVFDIGVGVPSRNAVHANCHALARYAALCQAHDIVPIVEPELLMDGVHSLQECFDKSRWILTQLFRELYFANVALEGIVLKPNMAIAGKKCALQGSVDQVATQTIALLKSIVPASVPGVAFLSGGQSDVDATAHLNRMNQIGGFPWKMTFSYGRALQAAPQKAWAGRGENVKAAQAAFAHRARMNSLASLGQWSPDLES